MADNWRLTSVIDYYRADPEIAGQLTVDQLDEVLNPEQALVNLVRTAIEYQGFDPKVVLKALLAARREYEQGNLEERRWDLSNANGGFTWIDGSQDANAYTNNEPLMRDIAFLLMTFLGRNNHVHKVLLKARTGLAPILGMLMEKYAIDDTVRPTGTQIGSQVITIPRIAGIFPSVAVKLFHMNAVKEIVPYELIPGVLKPETHAIVCPFLPSCVPHVLPNEGCLHALMLYVAITLDDTIHRRSPHPTELGDLVGYYRASFDSAAMPETARVQVVRFIGLTTALRGPLTPAATAVNDACLDALEQMRLGDPSHARMIHLARFGIFT